MELTWRQITVTVATMTFIYGASYCNGETIVVPETKVKTVEMKVTKVKFDSARQFVEELNKVIPQDTQGILRSIILGQAVLESWRSETHSLSKLASMNNLFGMKQSSTTNYRVVAFKTQEFINGEEKTVKEEFCIYKSWEQCLEHYFHILAKDRYAFVTLQPSAKWQAEEIAKVYATDPEYGVKLLEIIEELKLEKFDK